MRTPEPPEVGERPSLFEPVRPARRGGELAAATPEALAEDVAAGLAQLGWVVRKHPELAPALLWELSGLTPQLVLDPGARSAIVADAAGVGATAAPARYSGPEFAGTVLSFGQLGAVRLLVPIPRSAEASGDQPANPPIDHALVRAKHAAATAGPGLVDLEPPPAAPVARPSGGQAGPRLGVADCGAVEAVWTRCSSCPTAGPCPCAGQPCCARHLAAALERMASPPPAPAPASSVPVDAVTEVLSVVRPAGEAT